MPRATPPRRPTTRRLHPPRSGACSAGLALLAALLLAPAAVAEDPPAEETDGLGFGAELDVVSRYLWRGLAWSDGAVLQPSAWLARGGLSVGLWSNLEHDGESSGVAGWHATELDLAVGWETSWRSVTIAPSLAVYDYTDAEDSPTTAEALVEVTVPLGPLDLVSSHAFDLDEYRGSYVGDVGLTVSRLLRDLGEIRVGCRAAWASREFNAAYVGVPLGGFYLLAATAEVERCAPGWPCLRLHGEVARLTRAELAEAAGGRTRWAVGLAVGHEF